MSFAFEKVHVIRMKLQQGPVSLVFKIVEHRGPDERRAACKKRNPCITVSHGCKGTKESFQKGVLLGGKQVVNTCIIPVNIKAQLSCN